MANLALVFATGLTTGGLSCLAVQGGMLASSLAGHTEQKIKGKVISRGPGYDRELTKLNQLNLSKKAYKKAIARLKHRYPAHIIEAKKQAAPQLAMPIILFLGAKIVSYTILGFALGWLGSLLQLTPIMRAVLQIIIGAFMIVTALRLLNIHPFFRHFVIEPPKFVTRYIRRKTKKTSDNWLAPIFLGALTVLIPCGVTQAMMALAIASGSPISGGLIMFAFTLGTTPLFFTLAYLAAKLGSKLQDRFWKLAAVVLLMLGVLAIDSGLNLAGAPISSSAIKQALAASFKSTQENNAEAQDEDVASVKANDNNELEISITDSAYSPSVMQAKAGQAIKLKITTGDVRGCARSFVIPSLNIQKVFEPNQTTTLELPPQKPSLIRMTCSMGMYSSQIIVN